MSWNGWIKQRNWKQKWWMVNSKISRPWNNRTSFQRWFLSDYQIININISEILIKIPKNLQNSEYLNINLFLLECHKQRLFSVMSNVLENCSHWLKLMYANTNCLAANCFKLLICSIFIRKMVFFLIKNKISLF